MRAKRVVLDDIAEVSAGNPAPQDVGHFSDDGEPFVRMQDVGRLHHSPALTTTADRVTAAAIRANRLRLFPAGTLLIPKSGASINLNHRALLARSAYVVSHLATVIPDHTLLDPSYLYFWSLTYDPRSQAQTTSLPSLPLSLIRSAQLPLPSIDEQRNLVDLLRRGERIVRLRRAALEKAEMVLPALFEKMFGNRREGDSELWPVAPLGEVADVISGIAKGRNLVGEDVVDLPYMRVANVKDGYLDLKEVKAITVRQSEVSRLLLQHGDVLLTEGGDPDKLGRGAVWRGEIDRCVHQNHVFKVRCDSRKIVPEYLNALTGSPYGKSYFLRVAKKTTGIASINKGQLSAFPVPLPPIAMQRRFSVHLETVRAVIAQQAEALDKAETAFSALLQRTFGG